MAPDKSMRDGPCRRFKVAHGWTAVVALVMGACMGSGFVSEGVQDAPGGSDAETVSGVAAPQRAVSRERSGSAWALTARNQVRYETVGGETWTVGAFGCALGQFNHPMGVAVASWGEIFVADYDNARIQRLGEKGKALSEYRLPREDRRWLKPVDCRIDEGNVLVAVLSDGRTIALTRLDLPEALASRFAEEPALVPPGNADHGADRGTQVVSSPRELPGRLEFGSPIPNPTGSGIYFEVGLSRAARLSVQAFDVAGRQVRRIVEGPMGPGWHRLAWDGRDESGAPVASGSYFLRVSETPGASRTRKVIILR